MTDSMLKAKSATAATASQMPLLLAPAGNWDCAKAAIENGADAIYFGLDRFNARMRAANFTAADLPELMSTLHSRGVKGYVTLNTLVFTHELAEAESYLRSLMAAGVDAVIVQDVGICRLIRHLSPDFPIHASTQMTVTSAAGVEFAQSLGSELVVLARECSLKDIRKIQKQLGDRQISLPLEVFVHGALCVAYSGQCLTSEALGGRSANRGECAQACRMPYDLIADGKQVELGDRRYLLSPQDLSGLEVLPELVQASVSCLKIEGRLKSPEYVANVTRVYREAIDRVQTTMQNDSKNQDYPVSQRDQYQLEMAFSRGLYSGWFRGINNQELVHAQFGKKRGVFLGEVTHIHNGRDKQVTITSKAPVKPGDGVVFDNGHPDRPEEGGRIYAVDRQGSSVQITFGRRDIDLRRVNVGDRLWKTSDPELDRQLRQSFAGDKPKHQRPISIEIYGTVNEPLTIVAQDEQGNVVQVESAMPLVEAHSKPLTPEKLQNQLGRLGNTAFRLKTVQTHLNDAVMLPVSELNRLRREIVQQLEALRQQPKIWQINSNVTYTDLLPTVPESSEATTAELIVLVRNFEQLQAVLQSEISTIYCEFEDPRAYKEAVQQVRQQSDSASIWVAPPRITKPGENWILQQVQRCQADGYLVRNYDQLTWVNEVPCRGDFSLNVANPITAHHFMQQCGLQRLTASYDLTIQQLTDLLTHCPADWFEVTIHQHIPMFHMEHCVFCAFLSEGTDYTNCGRPCETHQVTLRDRVGTEHILQADAGCRNTVFNGTAQTGAEYVQTLVNLGVRHLRLEFVNESPAQVQTTIQRYQQLLRGDITGQQLWRELKLQNQLGVTRGSLDARSRS